ncbi:limonene-1,2-epoxide hydrolase family protein [Streptomyces sp. PA03-5A]|nr:limonene-1,2-epoxide hydrolase family protein [Streptomyces sp. PA03-5A]
MNNATPLEVVRDFCTNFGPTYDDAVAMFKRLAHPDISWQSVSSINHPVESLDALLKNLQRGREVMGAERFRVDVHHIEADTDVVMVHRTDSIMDREGDVLLSIDMMAMFGIEDGRIRWSREYFFDSRPFTASWEG